MSTDFNKILAKVEKEQAEAEETKLELKSNSQRDNETRQEVAKKFVKYYFVILILIIVGVPTYNYLVYRSARSIDLLLPLKDIILTYSAVVGPTLGLVVAYYFKTKND